MKGENRMDKPGGYKSISMYLLYTDSELFTNQHLRSAMLTPSIVVQNSPAV